MTSTKFSFLTAALVLALVGCGGGGASSAPSPAQPVPPSPVSPSPLPPAQWKAIVTSVPAPSYSGNNLLGFDRLNGLRAAAGVGLLTQNPFLDKSAANHNSYLFNNPNYFASGGSFHSEAVGNVGFTGATVQARASAAGYIGLVSESGTGSTGSISTNTIGAVGWGDFDVHVLINNTVYHRFGLLSNWTDVGLSVVSDSSNPQNTFTVINLGNAPELTFGQLPAAPVVYPYANQSGVDTTFVPISEVPNPAPDLGTYTNPMTIGLPVTVSLESISTMGFPLQRLQAADITILAFKVTAQGSSTPLASRVITAAGVTAGPGVVLTDDPVVGQLAASQICLLPLAPLSVNTVYNAVFTATVKGKPINLTWSFTTGTNK